MATYQKPDAADLAAGNAWGFLRNHPFAEGNKRTSWAGARLFVADNGCRLQFDPAAAVWMVEATAAGCLKAAELAA
jgi:death on curing protein